MAEQAKPTNKPSPRPAASLTSFPMVIEKAFESAPTGSPKGTKRTLFKARVTIQSATQCIEGCVAYAVWGVQNKAREGAFGWTAGTVVECDGMGKVRLTMEQQWALMTEDEKNRFRAMVQAEMQTKAAQEMASHKEEEKKDEFSDADVTE